MPNLRHKMPTIVLTWAAVWPFVTLLLLLSDHLLVSLPLPLKTLVVSTIMVPIMVLAIGPFVAKLQALARFKAIMAAAQDG